MFHRAAKQPQSSSSNSSGSSPTEPAPLIHTLYEELSGTWQYVVADPITRHAVIIDPHLDNAPSVAAVSTIAADRMLAVCQQNHYFVDRILHTHEPHEQGSSAFYIRAQLLQTTGTAPLVTVGKKMSAVQRVFKRKYSMNDGSAWKTEFDTSFDDGQTFTIGTVQATALHFPNDTLAFVIGQHIFAGTSRFDLEVRHRYSKTLGDLDAYRIYTSKDRSPQRRATLVPVLTSGGAKAKTEAGRKLMIRYAAETQNKPVELEGSPVVWNPSFVG